MRPRCEHPRSGVIAADFDAYVQALAALCGTLTLGFPMRGAGARTRATA